MEAYAFSMKDVFFLNIGQQAPYASIKVISFLIECNQ